MSDALAGWFDNVRTDMAVEAHDLLRSQAGAAIPGVRTESEVHGQTTISRVIIETEEGSRRMGRLPGRYITLDCPALRERNRTLQTEVAALAAKELRGLLQLRPQDEVLVVGLGNGQATPDALGPRLIDSLLVTRHLRPYVPEDLRGDLRGVAAIAPGVLGITGIETYEVVHGLVQHVRPDVVICVDALAARAVSRLCTSIQMADSGIAPGSGIGNRRQALNRETLGVPVFAIGVPTVVHALTVASDAIDALAAHGHLGIGHQWHGTPEQRRQLLFSHISADLGELIVTPKEIDRMVSDMAHLLADALNQALHPDMTREELALHIF